MQTIHIATRLFTGHECLNDHAIVVQDGVIADILPVDWLPGNFEATHSHYIVPSFIDAQVYGARGKLFSVFPSAETLQLMHAAFVETGTRHFLPTVATNTDAVMYACIDAVKNYWHQGGEGVIGLHLEGPWINPEKRGAHLQNLITTPNVDNVRHLLDYGKGIIKMITLAPEVCSAEIISLIRSYGIIVSAGHSAATFAEAMDGFQNGITTVTHLFNAMTAFHHRDVGLPGATLLHPSVMASLVADGHHVDFQAIRLAKMLMKERLFLITDAVTETTVGPYRHVPEDDKCTSRGILSGSSLTMLQAVRNCIKNIGTTPEEAFRMAGMYPARMLGVDAGVIQVGGLATFIGLDEGLERASHFS